MGARDDPELLAVARSAGLRVLEAPLMVLDPAALPDPATLVRRAGADRSTRPPRLRRRSRRASCGGARSASRAAGTATGAAGPAERDAAVTALDTGRARRGASPDPPTADGSPRWPSTPDRGRAGQRHGHRGSATSPRSPGWPPCQPPRRRGLGAAVTAHPGPGAPRHRHRPGLPVRWQRGDRPGLPAGRLPPHRHRLHRRTGRRSIA